MSINCEMPRSRTAAGSLDSRGGDSLLTNQQISLATLSYSIPIAGAASFYATGFKDLHDDHSYGLAFGISLALGPSISASVGGIAGQRTRRVLAVAGKPALAENDYRLSGAGF